MIDLRGVSPGGGGMPPREQRRARRRAERAAGLRVLERQAAGGESIQVGRLGANGRIQRADPIVEIIGGEEDDVGLGGGCGGVERRQWGEQQGGEGKSSQFHGGVIE